MERRDLLLSVGSVSTIGIMGAGCIDDTPNNIEKAQTDLDEAAEILEENDTENFNSDEIIRRTDSAREELSKARADASDEEIVLIENLELIAETLEQSALGLEKLNDLINRIDTVDALISAERYGEAADEMETISNKVDEVNNHLQNSEQAFSQIDSEAYDEFDELDQADFEDSITESIGILNALDTMLEAFDPLIDGLSNFEKAIEETENERWNTAEVRFTDAAEKFEQAASIAQEGLDEAPNEYRSEFIELRCLTESLQEGSEHFADAMNHLSNRRRSDAEEAIDDADQAFNRC